MYDFLKSKYAITDNQNILFSRLEDTKQAGRPIAVFASEFRTRVEELRMVQNSSTLSDAYLLSIFKKSLDEAYRKCADEHFELLNIDTMFEALILWERNFESREKHLPNSKTLSTGKIKMNLVQRGRCSFCKRGFHTEELVIAGPKKQLTCRRIVFG